METLPAQTSFKIWIEVFERHPNLGLRAKLSRAPGSKELPLKAESMLGRWRYLRSAEEVEDYLILLRPTHLLRLSSTASPYGPDLEAHAMELATVIKGALAAISEKESISLLLAEVTDEIAVACLQTWDERPEWTLRFTADGVDGPLSAVFSEGWDSGRIKDGGQIGPLKVGREEPLLRFLTRLKPAELLSYGSHWLLPDMAGGWAAAANQTERLVRDKGEAILRLRKISERCLLYRSSGG